MMRFNYDAHPPRTPRKLRDYSEIFEAITTCEWISVPRDEIAGKSRAANQTAIHQAANVRGLAVTTQTDDNYVYLRLKVADTGGEQESGRP
jgi:hypothetical protein